MKANENAARDYWNNNPNAMYAETSWISNPMIPARLYSRINDGCGENHWLNWTLKSFLNRQFKHAISPGCGSGGHEIMMLKSGFVEKVDAFDFSETSIGLAKISANEQSLFGLNAYVDDLNTFSLKKNVYDLALFAGSLHHVRNLENCLHQIQQSLVKDGVLVVWEYVGPCYLMWREKQLEVINRLLNAIPAEFKNQRINRLDKVAITQQLISDPSEATRSALIVDFLKEYFDFFYVRKCGGTIMHPMYPLLNHERLMQNDVGAQAVLNMLMETEEILIENNVLESDYMFILATPKG